MLKEKRFLLMTATGLFLVFTLFASPLFYIVIIREGGFIQVLDGDPYYFLRQASAQGQGEGTEGEVPTDEVDQPPPTTEEPPPSEPDVQEVVPEEGGRTAEPTTPQPPTEEQQPLTASFSIDSTNGDTAPATFLFEADAQGGTGPYTYSWDFDDSPQGNEQFIHHTFENPGTYIVTLTVTDSAGQSASTTRQVNVRPATITTEEQPPPTNATALPPMNQMNQTALTSATAVLEGCVTNPAGTIYCPYVPPTNGTTSALPLECVSTTAGIFCPSNETDPGVVEYTCISNPRDPKAPLECICRGAKDCLDLELSGRCEGHVIAGEVLGSCTEKRR